MAELLSDSLRPASFRGVRFLVDASRMDGVGRRNQVHEYPQRDNPYVQDMGRSTRDIGFEAFVIGADYISQAENLLGALEEYGAGTLIHPWFGSIKVNVQSCSVAFDNGLGIARFALNFVESGNLEFPRAADSTAALSKTAATSLQAQSQDWFATVFKVAGFVSDVTDKAFIVYGNVLSFMANPVFALASLTGYGSLPGNLLSLKNLMTTPLGLASAFAGLLDLSVVANSGKLSGDAVKLPVVRGIVRMATDPALAVPVATQNDTDTAKQIAANRSAILANTRQLLLMQAVTLSATLDCSVYDDTLAVKNELAAALDAEMLAVDADALYLALLAARQAMWADLTERSRNSARLVTITPPTVLPALVIAYDWHEDAGRDLEIVERNKIKHPGFVPVQPLQVLSV